MRSGATSRMLAVAATALSAAAAAGDASAEVIGHSARGRPIHAVRVGAAGGEPVLVVGSVHGNEPAGKAIVRRLPRTPPSEGTTLWLVDDLNPDGAAAGTRQNARGVDLNRNFPFRWRASGSPFDTYHSGSRALSEPESRAAARLIKRIRPRASIWYHQALRLVTHTGGDQRLERLYSARTGLPHKRLPRYPGTVISWQNHRFHGTSAFVVELPGGPLTTSGARRHAAAVRAVARAVARPDAVSVGAVVWAAARRPRVVQRPIPFPNRRKREMRAYARRHYGIDDFLLRGPKVVVQHYTVSNTFGSVFNTFARDAPDPELHELPGVCSHYVIDRDGTIYQLVPTRIMCRHTVGLNWTSIGIEHVGQSDAQVMGNRRQLRSSLALTRYLQGRFGIRTRDVIGHNESLSSPHHREKVARLRSQTHGDFRRATMQRYRRMLGR